MSRTALYRHYDAEGRLLYVGISINLLARTGTHAASSSWQYDISRIDVEWFSDPSEAARKELMAIKAEKPLHNRLRSTCANAVQEVIDAWPKRREFADAVGCKLQAAHKWAQSGRIPAQWQAAVVRAAQAQGLTEIDADWMLRTHEGLRAA